MDITTILRKVKRQFGDEYNILINDQDIYDWLYEAQLKVIRETSGNDVTSTVPATSFPVGITDKVMVKRVAINNKALTYTNMNDLDLSNALTTQEGTPLYWYVNGGSIGLWPQPASTDTYNVLVTYAKTPTQLTLVAPYLKFVPNSPNFQRFTLPPDTDFDQPGLNVTFEVTFVDVNADDLLLAKGDVNDTVAGNFAYTFYYLGRTLGVGKFQAKLSDGTTIRTINLDYPTVLTNGTKVKFRLRYDPAGILSLYSIPTTGPEVLLDSDTQTAFNLSVTAGRGITSGALGGTNGPKANFLLHSMVVYFNTTDTILAEFNGDPDLSSLPTLPATPFTITSGHEAQAVGDIQVYNDSNELSVPEVWHEDLVRFCIARAHEKNRDHKSAETALEQFNQNVSSRRNEADGVDAPTYKGADPFDYGWDQVEYYG